MRGITGESFVAETLIPPEGIPPLCDDQGLRATILDLLPTLDESSIAVRQTSGRDPHRGIQIPGVPVGGSRPADDGSRAPPAALTPLTKARGLRAVLLPQVVPGGRRERGGTDCATSMTLSSRIHPLIRTSPRRARGQLAGSRRLPPRTRARRGASVLHQTTISPAATAIIWLATASGAAAGAADVSLPGSLEGSGPQVCVPLLFPHWSSYHVDG
jgi:hypothetical protein